MKRYLYIILLLISNGLIAQIDSIKLSNGNLLVGEIKSMNKGVLVIETDFSDKDFQIEWDKTEYLNTQSRFLITLQDGTQYFSTVESFDDKRVVVYKSLFDTDTCLLKQIVLLNAFEDRFIDRLKISIDVTFDIAKSRSLRSFSTNSDIAYKAEKWATSASFNSLWSTQDETEDIERNEGVFNYRYFLPRKWYSIATYSFLKSSEQNLDLRSNIQLSMGRFLIVSNEAYWGVKLGVNRNMENYSATDTDSIESNVNSWEALIGSELDLYDIGDFRLGFSFSVYPSLTEKGRLRSDSKIDLKYDLPFDFYIRFGGSVNFDNQPGTDVSKWDYVIQTGIGWEL